MKVGIVGSGAIGQSIGGWLADKQVPQLELVGLHGIEAEAVAHLSQALKVPALALPELIDRAELIVEATGAAVMPGIVRQTVTAGKKIIALSVGGFCFDSELYDFIEAHGQDVYLPSGGIAGLDGLLALRELGLDCVEITTIKAPQSLQGAPYFAQTAHENLLKDLVEARTVFSGTARQAIKEFPANVNLAISVSLAGLGFDKTRVTIIADPKAKQTRQHLRAEAQGCRIETVVEGLPLPENPRTALLALCSVKALLRKVAESTHIGT